MTSNSFTRGDALRVHTELLRKTDSWTSNYTSLLNMNTDYNKRIRQIMSVEIAIETRNIGNYLAAVRASRHLQQHAPEILTPVVTCL